MKNKGFFTLLGLSLFILGFTSLVMQSIGVQWAFLKFLELPGRLFAFVAKIMMVLAGIVMLALSNTNWERERRESSQD